MNFARLCKLTTISIVSLMISGLPATVAVAGGSDAAASLTRTVTMANAEVVRPVFIFRNALQQAQYNPEANPAHFARFGTDAFSAMYKFKKSIEETGSKITDSDGATIQNLFPIVVSYFSFKSVLHLAVESFQNVGVSTKDLETLDLVMPAKTVGLWVKALGEKAMSDGGEIYDIPYLVTDAPNGMKRISMHAYDAARFRMGAYIAYPSAATAKKAMVFEALKIAFQRQAMINSFLYSDEIVETQLPGYADPVLNALQTHANANGHEDSFRRYVTTTLLQPLFEAVTKGRNQKAYREVLTDFFERLIATFKGRLKVKATELQAIGGATALADMYMETEDKNLLKYLQQSIKLSTIYWTELNLEGLKAGLLESVRMAQASLVFDVIAKLGIEEKKLPPVEQMALSTLLDPLLAVSVNPVSLNAQVVGKIAKIRKETDLVASFRRYDLAKKVIANVEWLDKATEALKRLEREKAVVPESIPKSPNPGLVIAALRGENACPGWYHDIIESMVQKASEAKNNPKTLKQLGSMARGAPEQLGIWAEEIRSHSNDTVIEAIKDVHQSQLEYTQYRWSSFDVKLKEIGKRVQSADAKTVLADFLRILQISDAVGSSQLRDRTRETFDALLGHTFDSNEKLKLEVEQSWLSRATSRADDMYKRYSDHEAGRGTNNLKSLNILIEEFKEAQAFTTNNNLLFQKLFAQSGERAIYLRQLLNKPEIFRNYIGVQIKSLQSQVPLLFTKLKMPSQVRERAQFDEPIMFHDLVSGLKGAAVMGGLDVSLAKKALSNLNGNLVKRPEILKAPMPSGLTPPQLLISATQWVAKEDLTIWQKGIDWILDEEFDRQKVVQTDDSFWPTQFKGRDVLPAYFDANSTDKAKAQRIIVATMLAPYLRMAAVATKEEEELLLDPSVDRTKMLVQSEAYRLLSTDSKGLMTEGLSEIEKKANKWKHRMDWIKSLSNTTQEYAGYAMYGGMFLKIPDSMHMVSGWYMYFSLLLDYGSESILLADYFDSYGEMANFARAGVLGKALVRQSELESIRSEMGTLADKLINRSAMDVIFLSQATGNLLLTPMMISMHIKASRMQERLDQVIKTSKIDRDQLSYDTQNLAIAFGEVGMSHLIGVETFDRAYKNAAIKLAPTVKTDPKVKEEFDRWVRARKVLNVYSSRYPELAKVLKRQDTPKK